MKLRIVGAVSVTLIAAFIAFMIAQDIPTAFRKDTLLGGLGIIAMLACGWVVVEIWLIMFRKQRSKL